MQHYRRLSLEALSLLRRRSEGERVEVRTENLSAYRELAGAGIMVPVSGFLHGPEASFRFTDEGWKHREEWLNNRDSDHLPESALRSAAD